MIRAVNIKKSYGDRTVLSGVDINIEPGVITAILGPNGAGKTTCFYIITGLIRDFSGTIFLNGIDISRMPVYMRARMGVSYLPQESSVFRDLTVWNNIELSLEFWECNRAKRAEIIEKVLNDLSIFHLRNAMASTLSGGERRRLEVARCLSVSPSFILLDEPFAGVDPVSVGDIMSIINELKARGIGVLITDHNVRETLKIADKSYIIYDGSVIVEGSRADILANETVRSRYLGEEFDF